MGLLEVQTEGQYCRVKCAGHMWSKLHYTVLLLTLLPRMANMRGLRPSVSVVFTPYLHCMCAGGGALGKGGEGEEGREEIRV